MTKTGSRYLLYLGKEEWGLKNPFPIACGKRERRHDNRMNKESYKACLDI